jgi:hypothetical protein
LSHDSREKALGHTIELVRLLISLGGCEKVRIIVRIIVRLIADIPAGPPPGFARRVRMSSLL